MLVDELARCGVRDAVVCPGSRDAPLVYSFADHAQITSHSMLDERAAGFLALGLAKTADRPVALVCTSGTAAANFLPAVVEAGEAGVPLIVLTADRPPELRDVGAGQAIDQIKLFGGFVRWFTEVGNMPQDEAALIHHRVLACRAVDIATAANPGPVHLNFPLREPLAPVNDDLTALSASDAALGRAGGTPWTATRAADPAADANVAVALSAAKRPLIVAGAHADPLLCDAITECAAALGVPVLADALSGLRARRHASRITVVGAYEAILRTPSVAQAIAPDFVLRVGELPTSKPLREWLAGLKCDQAVMDPAGLWREPTRRAGLLSQADPAATLRRASDSQPGAEPSWREHFDLLEETAQAAVDAVLDEAEPFTEPGIARTLAATLPEGTTVWVSSSMPVRELEWFARPGDAGLRYLANRGANGIDGVVSSALGSALATGGHTVLLTGDLALLHDVGTLAAVARTEAALTIVCIDNGGGGIFEFLPVAEHPPHFEPLIATPSGADLPAIAAAFGLNVARPIDGQALAAAATDPGLVYVETDRKANRAFHDEIWRRVSRTLQELSSVRALDD